MWNYENLMEFLSSHSDWISQQAEANDRLGTLQGFSVTDDFQFLELVFEEGIIKYNFFLGQVGCVRPIIQISSVR